MSVGLSYFLDRKKQEILQGSIFILHLSIVTLCISNIFRMCNNECLDHIARDGDLKNAKDELKGAESLED